MAQGLSMTSTLKFELVSAHECPLSQGLNWPTNCQTKKINIPIHMTYDTYQIHQAAKFKRMKGKCGSISSILSMIRSKCGRTTWLQIPGYVLMEMAKRMHYNTMFFLCFLHDACETTWVICVYFPDWVLHYAAAASRGCNFLKTWLLQASNPSPSSNKAIFTRATHGARTLWPNRKSQMHLKVRV